MALTSENSNNSKICPNSENDDTSIKSDPHSSTRKSSSIPKGTLARSTSADSNKDVSAKTVKAVAGSNVRTRKITPSSTSVPTYHSPRNSNSSQEKKIASARKTTPTKPISTARTAAPRTPVQSPLRTPSKPNSPISNFAASSPHSATPQHRRTQSKPLCTTPSKNTEPRSRSTSLTSPRTRTKATSASANKSTPSPSAKNKAAVTRSITPLRTTTEKTSLDKNSVTKLKNERDQLLILNKETLQKLAKQEALLREREAELEVMRIKLEQQAKLENLEISENEKALDNEPALEEKEKEILPTESLPLMNDSLDKDSPIESLEEKNENRCVILDEKEGQVLVSDDSVTLDENSTLSQSQTNDAESYQYDSTSTEQPSQSQLTDSLENSSPSLANTDICEELISPQLDDSTATAHVDKAEENSKEIRPQPLSFELQRRLNDSGEEPTEEEKNTLNSSENSSQTSDESGIDKNAMIQLVTLEAELRTQKRIAELALAERNAKEYALAEMEKAHRTAVEEMQRRHKKELEEMVAKITYSTKEKVNDELEQVLAEFEQAKHAVGEELIEKLKIRQRDELDSLRSRHLSSIGPSLDRTPTNADKQPCSLLVKPTDAVSWPAPLPLSVLRARLRPVSQHKRPTSFIPSSSFQDDYCSDPEPHLIQVYLSTMSGSVAIKKRQEEIKTVLRSLSLAFDEVDVVGNERARNIMQKRSGRREPPQIFVGGEWRAGYAEFKEALEREELELLLKPQAGKNIDTRNAEMIAGEKNSEGEGVTRKGKRQEKTLREEQIEPAREVKDSNALNAEDEELLRQLELELQMGKISADSWVDI
ncbi:uncharacterized protein VTP21DRAFT_11678 [Calcarisporiella thermophila]|uniref:uncharacterized protein n=1 Tax=Calcarisporiella thermophila TaxID=911321 RepID=UPI0037434119